MQRSTHDGTSKAFIAIHPLDPEDASAIIPIRTAARLAKGVRWSVDARTQFDALMERMSPRKDVTDEQTHLSAFVAGPAVAGDHSTHQIRRAR